MPPGAAGGDGTSQGDRLMAAGQPRGASPGDAAQGTSAASRHRRRLAAAFAVVLVFAVVELAGAFITGSLSLLSDAGHLLTDVLGLGLALAAVSAAMRLEGLRPHHSFGVYRLEILAALVNAVLLVGLSGYVLLTAVRRLADPPEIVAGPMLAIAIAGLLAGLVAYRLLREGAAESLNLRGASLEVLADMVSSVGVVIAAVVMLVTGWPYADPLVAAGVGLWLLPRAVLLGREAVRILLQAAPRHIDVEAVHRSLHDLDGVTGVHDMHVWTLTSGMDVATAHLDLDDDADGAEVLDRACALLTQRYGIAHATVQLERPSRSTCNAPGW